MNIHSDKTVDRVVNTIPLFVPPSSLIMYTSTTKQISDKMKIIKVNLELGFLS